MTKSTTLGCLAAAGLATALLDGGSVVAQQPQQPATQTQAPAAEREPLTRAPNRRADEGRGPFKTLAIRGAILIDGTGAPPHGPVDVIVQGNRITAVRSAGTP